MEMVCEVMDWISVAQGKGASRAVVYAVMSLMLCAEFLDYLCHSLLLKRNLLNGVTELQAPFNQTCINFNFRRRRQ
jgi:hypothetical protein